MPRFAANVAYLFSDRPLVERFGAAARAGFEAVEGQFPYDTPAHAVKAEFAYEAREAEGTQTPAETLEKQRGTCRDFALLMMEAARSLGLAARFVTGYLYDTETKTVGGGATHAWCSIYLPGAGWVEYDPTNGLIAGTNLVRVGSTRTPDQAIPIAGGYVGAPDAALPLEVDVTVTLIPPTEPAPDPQLESQPDPQPAPEPAPQPTPEPPPPTKPA